MHSTLPARLFLSHHIQEPFQQMQRFWGGQTGGQKHQPEKLNHLICASGCDIGRKEFFSQKRSPSSRKAVPITLSQRGSPEEASPEVVRQSPRSRGQRSRTNPAVFLLPILFSINILFCFKMENTNVKGLTSLGLTGCESGHKRAASASNYYLNKSLEGWRQSKVAIIKCSLL